MNFAVFVDWARKRYNAGAWVPCVLTVQGDQIELISDHGVELRSRASELSVEVLLFGSFVVRADGREFRLSMLGGRGVPPPSARLERYVHAFRETHRDAARVSWFDPATQVSRHLEAAGARVFGRSKSRLPLLLALSVVVLGVSVASIVVAILSGASASG